MGQLTPAIAGYRPLNPTPLRQAEYALADRAALAGITALLTGLAITSALLSVANLVWYGRQGQPAPMLFAGWKRLGWICLWAIVVPLAVYALYAHLLPLGLRSRGLQLTFPRLLAEYVIVGAVIVGLLHHLSLRAIRRRAAELGIPLTRKPGLAHAAIVALLVAGVIASVFWLQRGLPDTLAVVLIVLLLADAALLIWLLLGIRRSAGGDLFPRVYWRSLMPILAAAAVVLGVVGGLALRQVEGTAVRNARFGRMFIEEVERSNFRDLRQRLIERHEQLVHPTPATAAAPDA